MSTFTTLRVLLPAELRAAAEEKATAEDRTVADVVNELLAGYVKAKPSRKAAKKT
jgi:molybdopterin converting factor small subunit